MILKTTKKASFAKSSARVLKMNVDAPEKIRILAHGTFDVWEDGKGKDLAFSRYPGFEITNILGGFYVEGIVEGENVLLKPHDDVEYFIHYV
jgi:hypothetical protein